MQTAVHKKTVFVGLSGGVDSSVSAKRLIDAGYAVVGVFIKTWQPDFITCTWEKERLDAMRVAAHLNIPFLLCDAEERYRDDVALYMINEYRAGRTPNPDVMCNKHVKFGAFFDFAREHGAEYIATGHYAQTRLENDGSYSLLRGTDPNKDQSYFLWTLTQRELAQTLFPVGDTPKPLIRKEAEHSKLPTFAKHDSQGICFLGPVDMHDFLSHYVTQENGAILDTRGNRIGTHDGALFYTLGQRQGLAIKTTSDTTAPWYVVAKNMQENTITVDHRPPYIQNETITLSNVHIINTSLKDTIEVQFRYRQNPITLRVLSATDTSVTLGITDKNIERPSPGQSCVFYDGAVCLGGGIVDES